MLLAATSAGVVAFLVFYVLSRPDVRLETTVGRAEPHAGAAALIHGRVTEADGDGVGGARLTVYRPGAQVRTARTTERGFYALDVRGACGTYRLELAAHASGASVTRRLHRRLCPGQSLELSGRVVATGNVVWVPLR